MLEGTDRLAEQRSADVPGSVEGRDGEDQDAAVAEPLEGAAYLATQDANPFGSLVAMYLYAEDPVSGVRAKAAGEVLENPVTGQLTAHFEGDPVFEGDPRYRG